MQAKKEAEVLQAKKNAEARERAILGVNENNQRISSKLFKGSGGSPIWGGMLGMVGLPTITARSKLLVELILAILCRCWWVKSKT